MNESVISVGNVKHKNSTTKVVRIVHISDTHLKHQEYLENGLVPPGDILIHSGDFFKRKTSDRLPTDAGFEEEVELLNSFFAALPHRHKIFVAGNHEATFSREDATLIRESLRNCVYLQDSSIVIEGIKFFGTPWTGIREDSCNRAFNIAFSDLGPVWTKVPTDTDVLITHSPPYGILDLGLNGTETEAVCDLCGVPHKGMSHFGCRHLKDQVFQRIKPKAHLFGHAHESNGTCLIDDVLFSNAARYAGKTVTGSVARSAVVIDYYTDDAMESHKNSMVNSSNCDQTNGDR